MTSIEWQAPEYIHTDKTSDWYWVVGIITISIAAIATILNDPIFGLFVIVAAVTLSLYASKEPRIVTMKIDEKGVAAGDILYPFEHLKSFWVETNDRYPRILLKSEKVFMPYITVLLEDTDPEPIHRLLSAHLPEEKHSEPLLAKLLIYFGF